MNIKVPKIVSKMHHDIYEQLSCYGFIRNFILFPIGGFMRTHRLFGMHKPYDKILEVKDIHKGERCFIVATGPSLTVEDVNMIKGEYSFGVNTIFKIFEDTDWKPNYYVMGDPLTIAWQFNNTVYNYDEFAKNNAFLNVLNRNMSQGENVIYLNICFLDHSYNFGKSKIWRYNPNFLFGVYDSGSVVQLACELAIYMGFKQIYLMGADNNYLGKRKHFKEIPVNQGPEYAKKTHLVNNMGYEFIHKIAKENGVEIFNATRGGMVEEFPRVQLEDIVGV